MYVLEIWATLMEHIHKLSKIGQFPMVH